MACKEKAILAKEVAKELAQLCPPSQEDKVRFLLKFMDAVVGRLPREATLKADNKRKAEALKAMMKGRRV